MAGVSDTRSSASPQDILVSQHITNIEDWACKEEERERTVSKSSMGQKQSAEKRYYGILSAYSASFMVYVGEEGSDSGHRKCYSFMNE